MIADSKRVCLAAVVGLVIEEMIECRRQRLLDRRPAVTTVRKRMRADEIAVAQARDVAADQRVFVAARSPQRREIVVQDSVKARRQFACRR